MTATLPLPAAPAGVGLVYLVLDCKLIVGILASRRCPTQKSASGSSSAMRNDRLEAPSSVRSIVAQHTLSGRANFASITDMGAFPTARFEVKRTSHYAAMDFAFGRTLRVPGPMSTPAIPPLPAVPPTPAARPLWRFRDKAFDLKPLAAQADSNRQCLILTRWGKACGGETSLSRDGLISAQTQDLCVAVFGTKRPMRGRPPPARARPAR